MSIRKAGVADLPLHSGPVPEWLLKRMEYLADKIVRAIIMDYGSKELLRRISDPYWFQCFGCLLGFDWHSSGVTTVVVGVLKSVLSPDCHGVAVLGGKGRLARKVPEEVLSIADDMGLSDIEANQLIKASKLSAKVDNSVLQDGYDLYHHALIVDERGSWAIVQQGLNPDSKTARRYHWIKECVTSFVVEPHSGISSERIEGKVIDMTAKQSEDARRCSVDLVRQDPSKLAKELQVLKGQLTLTCFDKEGYVTYHKLLKMPLKINWEAVKKAYDIQPSSYEELIAIRGLGKETIRALALVSQVIYGHEVSWKDPVKYTFAFGGKDGVPYPIRKNVMDEATRFLQQAIEASDVDRKERLEALKRLSRLSESWYSK